MSGGGEGEVALVPPLPSALERLMQSPFPTAQPAGPTLPPHPTAPTHTTPPTLSWYFSPQVRRRAVILIRVAFLFLGWRSFCRCSSGSCVCTGALSRVGGAGGAAVREVLGHEKLARREGGAALRVPELSPPDSLITC